MPYRANLIGAVLFFSKNIMRDATLCFLTKEENNKINEICLAMKKRGFGVGRWNGTGGKVGHKQKETIEDALIREAQEEINVQLKDFYKVAELTFHFPKNKEWDQLVHVYFTKTWHGDPQETEEMRPKWFSVNGIPFESMWPDDIHWLPHVLDNKFVKAEFVFDEGDIILEQEVNIVDKL